MEGAGRERYHSGARSLSVEPQRLRERGPDAASALLLASRSKSFSSISLFQKQASASKSPARSLADSKSKSHHVLSDLKISEKTIRERGYNGQNDSVLVRRALSIRFKRLSENLDRFRTRSLSSSEKCKLSEDENDQSRSSISNDGNVCRRCVQKSVPNFKRDLTNDSLDLCTFRSAFNITRLKKERKNINATPSQGNKYIYQRSTSHKESVSLILEKKGVQASASSMSNSDDLTPPLESPKKVQQSSSKDKNDIVTCTRTPSALNSDNLKTSIFKKDEILSLPEQKISSALEHAIHPLPKSNFLKSNYYIKSNGVSPLRIHQPKPKSEVKGEIIYNPYYTFLPEYTSSQSNLNGRNCYTGSIRRISLPSARANPRPRSKTLSSTEKSIEKKTKNFNTISSRVVGNCMAYFQHERNRNMFTSPVKNYSRYVSIIQGLNQSIEAMPNLREHLVYLAACRQPRSMYSICTEQSASSLIRGHSGIQIPIYDIIAKKVYSKQGSQSVSSYTFPEKNEQDTSDNTLLDSSTQWQDKTLGESNSEVATDTPETCFDIDTEPPEYDHEQICENDRPFEVIIPNAQTCISSKEVSQKVQYSKNEEIENREKNISKQNTLISKVITTDAQSQNKATVSDHNYKISEGGLRSDLMQRYPEQNKVRSGSDGFQYSQLRIPIFCQYIGCPSCSQTPVSEDDRELHINQHLELRSKQQTSENANKLDHNSIHSHSIALKHKYPHLTNLRDDRCEMYGNLESSCKVECAFPLNPTEVVLGEMSEPSTHSLSRSPSPDKCQEKISPCIVSTKSRFVSPKLSTNVHQTHKRRSGNGVSKPLTLHPQLTFKLEQQLDKEHFGVHHTSSVRKSLLHSHESDKSAAECPTTARRASKKICTFEKGPVMFMTWEESAKEDSKSAQDQRLGKRSYSLLHWNQSSSETKYTKRTFAHLIKRIMSSISTSLLEIKACTSNPYVSKRCFSAPHTSSPICNLSEKRYFETMQDSKNKMSISKVENTAGSHLIKRDNETGQGDILPFMTVSQLLENCHFRNSDGIRTKSHISEEKNMISNHSTNIKTDLNIKEGDHFLKSIHPTIERCGFEQKTNEALFTSLSNHKENNGISTYNHFNPLADLLYTQHQEGNELSQELGSKNTFPCCLSKFSHISSSSEWDMCIKQTPLPSKKSEYSWWRHTSKTVDTFDKLFDTMGMFTIGSSDEDASSDDNIISWND